jgi:hypothetical protein
MKFKYIIIKHAEMEVPLVFSRLLQHSEVGVESEIRSAGFCELNTAGKWVVGGQSVSLDLKPRPQDSVILNAYMGII